MTDQPTDRQIEAKTERRTRIHLPSRRPRGATPASDPELAPEREMQPELEVEVPVEQSVVDAALYQAGKRTESPATVAATAHRLREEAANQTGTMAWIGLYRPSASQLFQVADEFGLHEVALEDAIVAHQRPKLERYDEILFVVLRAATYLDAAEEVEFGEIHVFIGTDFVITVRHSATPDLHAVRQRMEADPDLLRLGPEAVLYAIVDSVVDGYAPVVAGLQKDIDEIETEVFRGDPRVSRRIYELSREVIDFQRSVRPLLAMVNGLQAGFDKYGTDEELRRNLRDVADHATIVAERVDGFRQMLADILTVNATLVSQAQNEEIKNLTEASYDQNEENKKVSAWAAILFAPTLIGTVYGMNFRRMPELGWVFGYPFALTLMLLVSLTLYAIFKRRGWL
ncbi:MAG: magnesium/cobalt transporter CorA [Candidatus Limnocylindria bacterium]